VGANHGYFTILGAGLVGERGLVFAFEPNPAVYEQLATHVRLNGFDQRVVLNQEALWDSCGEETFFISRWVQNTGISTLTPGASNIADGGLSPNRTIRVRTETFDQWRAANGVARIDLVKIDAEGAEAHIVRGMQEAVRAGRIGAVVCETEWDSDVHRLLCGFGFVPERLDTIGPLTNIAYAYAQPR
jgi:FkbM family methyltransferase